MILPTDDDKLLECAGRGDREAFAVLVSRYQVPIVTFIQRYFRSIEPHTAEDLAQGVFLAAWQSAPTFRPRASVRTWLFKMAVNACLNERRRQRVRKAAGQGARKAWAAGVWQGDAAAAAPDDVADLRAALAELPESQRTAMILRHYHDLTYAQIAEIMGVSVGAVESLLFRARQSLRRRLATGSDE